MSRATTNFAPRRFFLTPHVRGATLLPDMSEPRFDALHAASALHERRERVFLVLAGIFIGTLAMLNIIGITKFLVLFSIPWPEALAPDWLGCITRGDPARWAGVSWMRFRFEVPAGVLPYPITFLCTDLISEFYGRRRANFVVAIGFVVNLFVVATLWIANALPAVESQLDWQVGLLEKIYNATSLAVVASMLAYLTAQFVDVYLFHFWKKLTKGKYLWIRNNGSTMISQMVDTVSVTLITFGGPWLAGDMEGKYILGFLIGGYAYKVLIAALDTIPIYIAVHYLGRWLRIDPTREHDADTELVNAET